MSPKWFVRAARTQLGLGHEAFAKKLGVSRRTVFRWETGQSSPRPGDIMLIEKLLDEMKRYKTGLTPGRPA